MMLPNANTYWHTKVQHTFKEVLVHLTAIFLGDQHGVLKGEYSASAQGQLDSR